MIDFHTHILPGIDDGSESVRQSCALLETLAALGVDTVLLTSHYYGMRRGSESFLSEREEAWERLCKAYNGNVRLRKACECNVCTCADSDLRKLRALAIEGTPYILTELSFEKEWEPRLFDRLDGLLQNELIPVIAHAGLYPAVRKNPRCLQI